MCQSIKILVQAQLLIYKDIITIFIKSVPNKGGDLLIRKSFVKL